VDRRHAVFTSRPCTRKKDKVMVHGEAVDRVAHWLAHATCFGFANAAFVMRVKSFSGRSRPA
jgi:hypothetical protein